MNAIRKNKIIIGLLLNEIYGTNYHTAICFMFQDAKFSQNSFHYMR